jgi:hypothetical protein
MDRKDFLGKVLKTGMGLGGAMALSKLPACCGALPDEVPAPEKKADPELEGIKQPGRSPVQIHRAPRVAAAF